MGFSPKSWYLHFDLNITPSILSFLIFDNCSFYTNSYIFSSSMLLKLPFISFSSNLISFSNSNSVSIVLFCFFLSFFVFFGGIFDGHASYHHQ